MQTHWFADGLALYNYDCREVLPVLADASVDSVCTDPPYGLEFMGKDWDSFKPAKGKWGDREHSPTLIDADDTPHHRSAVHQPAVLSRCQRCGGNSSGQWNRCACASPDFRKPVWPMQAYQTWCTEWAAECFRVLKPGGYLVAFGGTRTYHRLASAIEDAGFEIRDSLHWLYGCLSADTEILTERGWRPGIEVAEGEQVAQWDAETGAVTLAPVQQVFRAPWDGPMRVLRNADTDQLLTPNHRVYHQPRQRKMTDSVRRSWYDGRWRVAEAGELSTWDLIRLPIAGEHDGPGIGGEDYAALLGWVWTEGGFDLSGSGVRIYQSSVNPDKVTEIAALLDRLGPHKRYDYQRSYDYVSGQREYTATTWFMSGDLAGRVRADLPGKRPTYPLLWRMTAVEKRAFLRAAMLGDGSGWGGKSEQFYQQHEDDLIWLQTLLALVGRSGKVGMRTNRPGGALYLRKVSMTELQAQHQRAPWQHYTGEVWCVRVPTGAFIARRNGRVFITGNSGFPKSLDVSKAIDKARNDRPDILRVTSWLAAAAAARGISRAHVDAHMGTSDMGGWWLSRLGHRCAVPTWDQWQQLRALIGFGNEMDTEVWRLNGRKGTPGEAWGQREVIPGGIGSKTGSTYSADGGYIAGRAISTQGITPDATRWEGWGTALKPAHEPIVLARKPLAGTVAQNVLQHGTGALNVDGCRVNPGTQVGGGGGWAAHQVKDTDGWDRPYVNGVAKTEAHDAGRWPPNLLLTHAADCDGECAPGCPVAGLDGQSGVSKSSGGRIGNKDGGQIYGGGKGLAGVYSAGDPGFGDSGGASRFFPQFNWSPEYDLPFLYQAKASSKERPRHADGSAHPTVKPLALMRWLARLVTPPGGTILDPFCGTGTTLQAARLEGFRSIGCDSWDQAAEMACQRLGLVVEADAG